MARRKTTAEGEPPAAEAPQPDNAAAPAEEVPSGNGEAEPRRPAFKVGPIATEKNNAVCVAVWENEVATQDGRTFKVHNVTVEARWRDQSGNWQSGKGFRGSQLYALIYCLQRASDFILSQRNPQNDCPF